MKRVLLTLAAMAAIGLATGTAFAQYGCGGGGYGGYGNYSYRSYQYSYRPPVYGYGHHYESHLHAAARIRATHSRYRYSSHPRSYYNSRPMQHGCGRW